MTIEWIGTFQKSGVIQGLVCFPREVKIWNAIVSGDISLAYREVKNQFTALYKVPKLPQINHVRLHLF